MKLLHLGDLHIGKSVNDYNMLEEQKYILDKILKIIEEKGVDGIFIAGDVYDKAVPSEEAVKVFDYFIRQLSRRRVKTFIISGNHDSQERLHFGSSLFASHDIYICAKYEGSLYHQKLQDEYGSLHIFLLPFVKASQVKHFFPEQEIASYDEAVRTVLKNADIHEEERNILVAHQFVAGGGREPELAGSENAAVQNVGGVEKVGADCFAAFDYVALGHIHSPQSVGRESVRYAGSPLKYSLSEIHNEKSVPLITVGKKGELTVELLPLKPRHDMRHLKGKMEQLLDKKNITDPEDYIYVTLTDEYPIPEAMAIIRQHYPNTMKIDYENAYTDGVENPAAMQAVGEKSFQEHIADFYQMMYGRDISREERRILMEAAGEAGVVDEAD